LIFNNVNEKSTDIKIKISDFGLSTTIKKLGSIADINKTIGKVKTQVRIYIF
jgi:hypothetical protein